MGLVSTSNLPRLLAVGSIRDFANPERAGLGRQEEIKTMQLVRVVLLVEGRPSVLTNNHPAGGEGTYRMWGNTVSTV